MTKPALLADSWKSIEYLHTDDYDRMVCLAHGSELRPNDNAAGRKRVARALSRASHIIANSAYTADILVDIVDNREKVLTIHPGIDEPVLNPAMVSAVADRLSAYSKKLITVARLEKRKNHGAVIRALPGLARTEPGILYIIVGDGPERSGLERLALDVGVRNNVLFTGRLDGAEKFSYLVNSDLFVMPGTMEGNDVEGFGVAYIEAASLGLPCIASNAGGAAEAVLHNKSGLVCAAGNQSQLEDAISGLLWSPERYSAMSDYAKTRAREFFWARRIKDYQDVLV